MDQNADRGTHNTHALPHLKRRRLLVKSPSLLPNQYGLLGHHRAKVHPTTTSTLKISINRSTRILVKWTRSKEAPPQNIYLSYIIVSPNQDSLLAIRNQPVPLSIFFFRLKLHPISHLSFNPEISDLYVLLSPLQRTYRTWRLEKEWSCSKGPRSILEHPLGLLKRLSHCSARKF